jgi:hypothetical protein
VALKAKIDHPAFFVVSPNIAELLGKGLEVFEKDLFAASRICSLTACCTDVGGCRHLLAGWENSSSVQRVSLRKGDFGALGEKAFRIRGSRVQSVVELSAKTGAWKVYGKAQLYMERGFCRQVEVGNAV